jgi:hypothetical protein
MITLEQEQQRHNERKSYGRVCIPVQSGCQGNKSSNAQHQGRHIDGYYKIFEETNSEQSKEVSKSSESVQELPGATTRKQEKPPPLPPQVQQQKQTTAYRDAAATGDSKYMQGKEMIRQRAKTRV